jgi:hypothetical protein
LPEETSLVDFIHGVVGQSGLESDLEELVRNNIELLFGADVSALIVGQQVRDQNNKRSDLIALTDQGHLVLIELKRSTEAANYRSEPLEFQAIRYAATLATIRSVDELVRDMFEDYVARHRSELDQEGLAQLTDGELAKRLVQQFLDDNLINKDAFNQNQTIFLVAPGFSEEALSACAWLSHSGTDIHCVVARPLVVDGSYFLLFDEVIPPRSLSDYYVKVRPQTSVGRKKRASSRPTGARQRATSASRASTMVRWPDLFASGVVHVGDKLVLDKLLSATAWGKWVKGWPAINIYDHAFLLSSDGRRVRLTDLRRQVASNREEDASEVLINEEA